MKVQYSEGDYNIQMGVPLTVVLFCVTSVGLVVISTALIKSFKKG